MPNSRLSQAASEIMRSHEQEAQELSLDGSGELGGRISRHMHEHRIEVLAKHGFTPEQYNQELRKRFLGEEQDADESHRVHCLLFMLEVEPMDEWLDNNTFVYANGELSSIAYLKGK